MQHVSVSRVLGIIALILFVIAALHVPQVPWAKDWAFVFLAGALVVP